MDEQRTEQRRRERLLWRERSCCWTCVCWCLLSVVIAWLVVVVCWFCMRRRASGQLSQGCRLDECQSLEETECQEQYSDKLRSNPFNPVSFAPSRGVCMSVGRGLCQAHIRRTVTGETAQDVYGR